MTQDVEIWKDCLELKREFKWFKWLGSTMSPCSTKKTKRHIHPEMVVFDLDNSRSWSNYHDSTKKWFDIPKGPFNQDFRINHLRQQVLVVSSNIPNHLSFVWNMIDNSSRWYLTNNKKWLNVSGLRDGSELIILKSSPNDPTGGAFHVMGSDRCVVWRCCRMERPLGWESVGVDFPASYRFASCLVSLKEDKHEKNLRLVAICDANPIQTPIELGDLRMIQVSRWHSPVMLRCIPSPLEWVFRCCFRNEACLWRVGLPSHHLETQWGRLCQGEDTETSYGFCWDPRSEIVVR